MKTQNRSKLNHLCFMQIDDIESAKAYLMHLNELGMLWHLEDSAFDCFPHLSVSDCEALNNSADQICALDWCPFEFMLQL